MVVMASIRSGVRWCSAVVLAVVVVVPVSSGFAAEIRTSAVPAKLVGVWSRNVDLKKYGVVSEPSGVWTIRFFTNGNVDVYMPAPTCSTCQAGATPIFSVTGARLKIGPMADCIRSEDRYGWYGLRITGRTLVLRLLSDSCGIRKALFTGTWKRD